MPDIPDPGNKKGAGTGRFAEPLSVVFGHCERLNECLNGRENMIVTKRFGMDGEEKQTLAQLGESLDLSRERIRQIERNALRKMKGKARKLAG